MTNIYYVYQLVDPRNNQPFYIGEGKGKRAWTHLEFKSRCNNPHKDRVIRKIYACGLIPIVEILHDHLSKQDAVAIQDKLILEIGLDNLTNICINANPPIKRGADNPFYGKHHKPETLQYLKDINMGIDRRSEEGKKASREGARKKWATDLDYRERALNAIKDVHLWRRELTKEEWSAVAAKREQNMSPEQKERRKQQRKEEWRIRKETELKGMRKQKYIDAEGKTRFKWIPQEPSEP